MDIASPEKSENVKKPLCYERVGEGAWKISKKAKKAYWVMAVDEMVVKIAILTNYGVRKIVFAYKSG